MNIEERRKYNKEYMERIESCRYNKSQSISNIIHSQEYMILKEERIRKRKEERKRQKLLKNIA